MQLSVEQIKQVYTLLQEYPSSTDVLFVRIEDSSLIAVFVDNEETLDCVDISDREK